jgi:transposase
LQKFYYKAHLFRYLQREYGLDCKKNTFNKYILNHREFNEYFKKNKKSKSIKTETPFGKQAQFDWKEKMKFYFSNGESIYIYVGSLVLSASRMKIWKIYLSSNQNNLFDFLTTSFETIGGIPKEIIIER